MPSFPSQEWFEEVRQVYNSDSSLHSGGGGACHTRAGFEIGKHRYLIVFDGEQCGEVRTASPEELGEEAVDFIIGMSPKLWRDMIANIQANSKADLQHTLNSIDLSSEESIAFSPMDDQYRQDLFYRYNQNFQDYFDASSRIETTFD